MKFLIVLGISFFLAVVFVYLSKKLAGFFRLYYYPDSPLDIHDRPVPFLGGLGIFLAVLITFAISYFLISNPVNLFWLSSLLTGGVLAFFLGLWDDLRVRGAKVEMTYKKKFIFQLAISGIVSIAFVMGGLIIKVFPLGIVGVLLMTFYILGGMNAVNLQDGLDGLAAGLVAISSVGFAILSILTGNTVALILSLSGLGAALGFLVYNFHPASIFMGDNGSYFLGFLVAVLAIIFTSKAYDLRWFLGPILIIGLPVADTAWTVIRRILQRKSIFQGDRGHIYDRMIKKGVSVRATVLICYLIQVALVAWGIGLTQL